MIAIVQIALPDDLIVLADEELSVLSYEGDMVPEGLPDVEVKLLPPYRSARPPGEAAGTPGAEPHHFNPADPQPVDPVFLIDDRPAVRCDTIAVNIIAPEFDRSRETSSELTTKLVGLACDAVNGALQRLRVLARAPHLTALEPENVVFRLAFADDAGEQVPEEEGKYRGSGNWRVTVAAVAVTPDTWGQLAELGEYEVPPWDELFLDAMNPEVALGPSLVLAASAVETRIATALDVLAEGKLPEGLWGWIRDRDGNYVQEPSLAEQLDVLLGALGGRSLKDDDRLWEAGANLRGARNTFVHEGRATIGKSKQPVTRAKATELAVQAGEIIDFIEELLPEDQRRPRLKNPSTLETNIGLFLAPGTAEGEEGEEASGSPS